MKKIVGTALAAGLIASSLIPQTSHAAEEESDSFRSTVVKTELQQMADLSSVSVMDENGKVHIQAVPPSSKWKIVDHFRGSSKNMDTASELAARFVASLPALWNKWAAIAANTFFPTFFEKKPTRYFSTTQYLAYDKKYRYTIIELYVYKDSKYSKQVGYDYKWFRTPR
ncbi:hypothetical protein OIO07_18745 [Bacillus paralicheniformis]|uniref:Uncharacterized protein n=2 Tax=Bacillus subtilis group TaxID=653685 RepID=A0AB37GXI0_BACLI|nr:MULTISPECIES: hypothetical protein [Bacillus]KJD53284.1 hypothetical protein UZ38_33365 [Bacillus amyloliquefaciens]KUL08912.1 hypothetical protein LI7559_14160 [Bacillus licheniformis LMG 7559]AGN35494.1 hypothetical protein BaLi_c11230 [Bacillus paralicheniformis ATCC 9945a]ARA84911.1 hypothetical protein BLMD_05425 [Bacillus paralicheniformis]ASB90816.1 hypothetical protein S101395_04314 [Bacillus sonorensis]